MVPVPGFTQMVWCVAACAGATVAASSAAAIPAVSAIARIAFMD
jgi:hypothetical protein